MIFLNQDRLPVEIKEHDLPKDSNQVDLFENDRRVQSGGFADAIFLGSVMILCFMFGMLVAIWR